MNPIDFIRHHITASLVAEGFSESVAGGGAEHGVDYYRRSSQASRKGRYSMIVSSVRVSGLLGRQPRQSGKWQRKSREEQMGPLPACSNCGFIKQIYQAGKIHEKPYQN